MLELAREQAEQSGQSRIAPEHLLLSILQEDEETPAKYTGVAIRILKEAFGLNLAHLEQQLRLAISQ